MSRHAQRALGGLQHFYGARTCFVLRLQYLRGVSSIGIRSAAFELPRAQTATTNLWKTVEIGERVAAAMLLIFTAPALLPAAMVIASISRRSPFVAHARVTRSGRVLWILKLRTMWHGRGPAIRDNKRVLVERLTPALSITQIQKPAKDPRVTSAFAAFCRRYSIDELPQLWHVLRGEMALVGPRPLTEHELDKYYGADAARILSRKPGLTGLWQIHGRSRLSYRQRRRLDLFLIRKWSLKLYLRILFATFPKVLAGKDAW